MIEEFANKHGIDLKLLQAIIKVESSGIGYNRDGSLKIRFENHLIVNAYPYLTNWFKFGNPAWTNHYFRFPSYSNSWRATHADQWSEYCALLVGCQQIGNKAFDFISMGSWQVMGFHYAKLGFTSSIQMYSYAQTNDMQLGLKFLESNPDLISSLQQKNLFKFISLYNGSGQVDYYMQRIKEYL